MSSVVIIAVGSRGDVAPLTGVGVALQHAGHRVAIAAYTPFAELILGCGLGFYELPAELPRAAHDTEVAPWKSLAAFASPAGMRALGNDILAAVADQPADVLLLSPFAELVGHPLAAAKGIPSLGVRMQPLSATAQYPPAVLGAWSAGAAGNRWAADSGAWLIDRLYGGVVAGFRRQLGLPRTSTRRLRKHRTKSQWAVLHGYSPLVAPRPPDWRPGLEVTGYWWPANAGNWEPPTELTDFLAACSPPVFIGFGSMVTTPARAKQLSDTIDRAARLAGVRVIVQAGWTGLHCADEHMLSIGEAPHDWLFPHVAAVAHHCGAGTTGAGLRAGVPTIGLPAYGDGAFWATRLSQLGVSATTINQRQLTAERLADAMRVAVSDPQLRRNARQLGSRISREDGTAPVIAAVETLLRQPI
ncbi:glycosyltransferase [Mycobacterium sp. pUA109]|uniref:glycosyltransferase n=1 Tax=Mycobacterium sp. pUA109 TaxID=3238982 RepID=UPI00351ABE7C